jgi:HlyD family secretion protein
VRQIRNAPTTVQNVVTYTAVIDVDNPDLELKPGMTANVTFIVGKRDDALRVPNAALRFRPAADAAAPEARRRPDGDAPDRKRVYRLQGTELQPVEVKVGLSDGSSTEILEGGLAAGDAVVTDAGGAAAGRPSGSGGAPGGGGTRRGGRPPF